MSVDFSKDPVDGRRPGDVFTRLGDTYQVVATYVTPYGQRSYITESVHGREKWF